jgi:hypothetical protein
MEQLIHTAAATQHIPWNKGKLIGQKAALKVKDIWAIRVRLQIANRTRELALFNLAMTGAMRNRGQRFARQCECLSLAAFVKGAYPWLGNGEAIAGASEWRSGDGRDR